MTPVNVCKLMSFYLHNPLAFAMGFHICLLMCLQFNSFLLPISHSLGKLLLWYWICLPSPLDNCITPAPMFGLQNWNHSCLQLHPAWRTLTFQKPLLIPSFWKLAFSFSGGKKALSVWYLLFVLFCSSSCLIVVHVKRKGRKDLGVVIPKYLHTWPQACKVTTAKTMFSLGYHPHPAE